MRLKPLVVLTSPPSRSNNHYRPPLALTYLAGHLIRHNIKCKIIDITLKNVVRNKSFYKNYNHVLQDIKLQTLNKIIRYKPKIVGITCYTPEFSEVLDLARSIKAINKKIIIVVGGIHPTLYPQDFLEEPDSPVDFEVIGEGEISFLNLVKNIFLKTKVFEEIRGIGFLKKGKTFLTPFQPLLDNLDLISHPAHQLVDTDYYSQASPYAIRGCFLRSAYLLATRGCPSTCTFCVAKKLRQYNGGGRYTRIRSAKSLLFEIKFLKNKYSIDSFYFIDDLFTINRENVISFCNHLRKSNLNLLWGCSSKVSTLNEEIIKEMSRSGCVQIDFGVERGSDVALNQVKKGIGVKQIINIFDLCHKYKIRTLANFLVNIPGETKKDLHDIVKLSQRLKSEIYYFNVFSPYPGTEIYDQMKYRFSKDEYVELYASSTLINKYPHKYRFHRHRLDILAWADAQNKRFNQILPNLKFHLSYRYLKTIFHSKRIDNYFHQILNLLKELLVQKYNIS